MAPRQDQSRERSSMARAAALLLVAGAVLGLVQILVPHSSGIDATAYAAIDVLGLAGAGLVWLLRDRLPPLSYHAVSAFGILCVTLSIYYSGNRSGGAGENELLFLWPVLYACYFFNRRGVAFQLALVGISYGAVLIATDVGSAGIARWAGTIGTLAAAAVLVRYLKEGHDRNLSMHEATIESTTDGILVVDRAGRWQSFNHKFLEMWRIPDEIVGSRDDDAALDFVLRQVEDPAAFIAKVREVYEKPDAKSFDEVHFKDARVLERYSQPHRVEGRTVGRVWSFRDVTAQKQAALRLQYLADHDPLTDLFNRRRFEEELGREIYRSERYQRGGALLLLDLDNLKEINDTYGHHWGDEALRTAARLLLSRLRSGDVVARFGGDEFAVLLAEADALHARKVAEEVLEIFREHAIPTDLGQIEITTSIGVVVLEDTLAAGTEALVAADEALYHAKRAGRDRYAFHDDTMERAEDPLA